MNAASMARARSTEALADGRLSELGGGVGEGVGAGVSEGVGTGVGGVGDVTVGGAAARAATTQVLRKQLAARKAILKDCPRMARPPFR
jgi:hypothetical protein